MSAGKSVRKHMWEAGSLAQGGAEPGVSASMLWGQAGDQGERVAGLAFQFA